MDIAVDKSAFLRDLSEIQKTQFPYALARTFTASARSGMLAGRERTRKAFELHGDFIPSQIQMTPAKVADFKYGIMAAEVRTTEKIAFLSDHEYGRVRMPMGRAIAVPSILAQRIPDLRSKSGKVRSKYLPKTLLRPGGTGYITAGMIFGRIKNRFMSGKKKGMPLFSLAGKARIRPEWHFVRVVKVRVERVILGHFKTNMDLAMSTMRSSG